MVAEFVEVTVAELVVVEDAVLVDVLVDVLVGGTVPVIVLVGVLVEV